MSDGVVQVCPGQVTHLPTSYSEQVVWNALDAAERYAFKQIPARSLRPEQAVGFVPVNPKLCFSGIWPNVGDEVSRLARLHDTDAGSLFERLDLWQLLERRPDELSGGESVRAAIAFTAASNPVIWVLDRCFEWLEPDRRHSIGEFMASELSLGKPVVELSSRQKGYLKRITSDLTRDDPICRDPAVVAQARIDVSTAEPMLVLRDVRFDYGSDFSLGPIDFEICRGESIVLRGPNGSGKTTLAKAISGLLTVDGMISIEGVQPRGRREWSSKVVYAFQNPDDQIYRSSVEMEVTEAARRVDRLTVDRMAEVCRVMGLHGILCRDPLTLPLSIRRLITLAAVLVPEVPLVIIDEPTAFLDEQQIVQLLNAIEFVRRSGTAVISITHDVDFVDNIYGQCVWMNGGRLLS